MRRFAVFDLDGTLLRWQMFHAVVNNLAKSGLLGKTAYQDIKDARRQWKIRAHPQAFTNYEQFLLRSYLAAVKSLSAESFDKCVDSTIQEYKDQAYVFTRDLLKELKDEGYLLFAISGSHSEIVDNVARHYGFDDWVGSTYERKGRGFTGKSNTTFKNKDIFLARLVEKHQATFKDSIAVGDSLGDISMLKAVENAIAFNPSPELFSEAKKYGWPIVIERKSVIYRLEPKGGNYLLAS